MARTKVPQPVQKAFAAAHRLLYTASRGRLGGTFGDNTIGLLTTVGRRTGKSRTTPLIVVYHGDGWAVTASASGHDTHPAWYLNLRESREASLRIGGDEHAVVARDAEGEERTELWGRLVAAYPGYADYEAATDRVIPVVVLARR